mmetsp:Transcript_7104/g.17022  ORF Transcript_7104/g.17022 Transcript_7104/m.17022 type:complete len:81 (+) Transcript_7104:149-391(+)
MSTGNFTDAALAVAPLSVLAFFVARVILHGFSEDVIRYIFMDFMEDASTFVACCVGALLCYRPSPSESNDIKLRLPYFAL